jgi:hypothetical protein
MPRRQLGGILDAHDPFRGRYGTQHCGQQGCLYYPIPITPLVTNPSVALRNTPG